MGEVFTWVSLALVPITNIITWIATKTKRRNETMQSLQETIDLFAKSNEKLSEQVIEQNQTIAQLTSEITLLKQENQSLKNGQAKMIEELQNVRKENRELKELLKNTKITKCKKS